MDSLFDPVVVPEGVFVLVESFEDFVLLSFPFPFPDLFDLSLLFDLLLLVLGRVGTVGTDGIGTQM